MKNKRLIIGLVVLLILVPIGIYLPVLFKAGDAWGEWSVETIKENLGFAPEGMQKDTGLWKAPISDYSLGNENDSIAKQSMHYIISGIVGVGIITLLSFGLYKIMKKE